MDALDLKESSTQESDREEMARCLALMAEWRRFPFSQEKKQEMEESLRMMESHFANPTPETLAELIRWYERFNQQAVVAARQESQLRSMVADLETKVAAMLDKYTQAWRRCDADSVKTLAKDVRSYETSLKATRRQFQAAQETLEQVKLAVQRGQERIAREKVRVAALFPSEESIRDGLGDTRD